MFDNGTITQMSPALKNFSNPSEIFVNPADYKAMGINEGKPVTLINGEKINKYHYQARPKNTPFHRLRLFKSRWS